MHVDLHNGSHRAGVPATLFEHRHVPGALTGLANYDVAPDAGGFMTVVEQEASATMMLHVTISAAGYRSPDRAGRPSRRKARSTRGETEEPLRRRGESLANISPLSTSALNAWPVA